MQHHPLSDADPEVHNALKNEMNRQESDSLEMIASENFVNQAVLEAQGSVLTNKYAEGYPGNRYYAGCEYHDDVENLARERAKDIFGAEHVNVQPHAGSQANFAAYFSVLEKGDRVLGPVLAHGGHLTHGHPVNFSGHIFDFDTYAIDEETERFERDEIVEAAREHDPDLIVSGYSAYPREIPFDAFREAAEETDAVLMTDIAHVAGLVAAGIHENPFPDWDIVTTTTHKTLRGARGGMIMSREGLAEDIDRAVFPFSQGGPLMHQVAGKAVSLRLAQERDYREYQQQIVDNAQALAEGLQENGFRLVSGGTDVHLVLADMSSKDMTGKEAESLLEDAGIVVNKNMIPYDERSAKVTSGVRIGTPALTTRGMEESELRYVADLIGRAVNGETDRVREEVEDLLHEFPLYEDAENSY
ncbi:MAG: serine hydroxymethyltransferase [Candidatus Nanohaloarchaeota archaeon QJJ-7]|nr:serine hydroxymethyltransferase [Candidatus Nanohaloarchaeota archaeon QJJ-7]